MKRILVIITTAFTATGGLASVMLNYYRSLDKKGLQIDFAFRYIALSSVSLT